MCELLAEHAAGRVFKQRGFALSDGSIDYLKISFNDCDGSGIELALSVLHDVLEHRDLSIVHSLWACANERRTATTRRGGRRNGARATIAWRYVALDAANRRRRRA